jgi:hypothetical protein
LLNANTFVGIQKIKSEKWNFSYTFPASFKKVVFILKVVITLILITVLVKNIKIILERKCDIRRPTDTQKLVLWRFRPMVRDKEGTAAVQNELLLYAFGKLL